MPDDGSGSGQNCDLAARGMVVEHPPGLVLGDPVPAHQDAGGPGDEVPVVEFFLQPHRVVFVRVRRAVTANSGREKAGDQAQSFGRWIDHIDAGADSFCCSANRLV